MRFLLIKPEEKSLEQLFATSAREACEAAGLTSVDFGIIAPGIGIMVNEFGLYDPPKGQYFSLGHQLFAGPAILFAYQLHQPELLIDMPRVSPIVRWFPDGTVEEIERAIESDGINRPNISINGEVIWEWPNLQEGRAQ